MTRTSLRIAVPLAALACAMPVAAEAPLPLAVDFKAVSTLDRASPSTPQLTSINYERLYRRLVQAGMISQVLGYTLTVDAEGKPVGCSFSREFRMLVTERDVCRSFLRSVTFEPARDAQGNPVAGRYSGEIEIASFFQPNL